MTPGYLLLAAAALAVLGAAAWAHHIEARARRWNLRRQRVLHERWNRADAAYGDELARAKVMMRPSLPDFDRWRKVTREHHSRKVRP